MALQKWAAPAGSPLLSTLTDTGPAGTFAASYSQTFAATSDIAVGAVAKIFAAGTITTTGTPTAVWTVNAFGAGPADQTIVAPTGVTGQKWTIEGTIVLRSLSGSSSGTFAYDIRIVGLGAADVHLIGTQTTNISGSFSVAVNWDSNANDADAGDIITIDLADALWIG